VGCKPHKTACARETPHRSSYAEISRPPPAGLPSSPSSANLPQLQCSAVLLQHVLLLLAKGLLCSSERPCCCCFTRWPGQQLLPLLLPLLYQVAWPAAVLPLTTGCALSDPLARSAAAAFSCTL